jgi:hypothetical protein
MNLEARKPERANQESRKVGMFTAVHGFLGSRCFPFFLLS